MIIKNLLPKGQCPHKQSRTTRSRVPKETKNGQLLPYKHRKRGISQIQNQHLPTGKPTSTHTGQKIANQTRPQKQATEQLYQLKQTHTPAKRGNKHTPRFSCVPFWLRVFSFCWALPLVIILIYPKKKKTRMWSCHIDFRKICYEIFSKILFIPFRKIFFIYFRKFALFILESLLYLF